MRTAYSCSALFLLWSCAPAMASKTTPEPATLEVKNATAIPASVRVIARGDETETLEPGAVQTFTIRSPSFTVIAEVRGAIRWRTYAFAAGECGRVTITHPPLRLSDPVPCDEGSPQDPPPSSDDPPPDPLPQASVLKRESLLAALSSTGLLALALVGLLINRHA